MQATLDAVASPRRRAIMRLVWDRELAAGQIAAHFDVSWPAISQNLNVLYDAGLVTRRHAGHYRLYQANHAALGPIEPFLRAMWATDLPPGSSTVEVTLVPDGDGTIVRLRHGGLPDDNWREQHVGGWGRYLDRLAVAASGGDPGPDV